MSDPLHAVVNPSLIARVKGILINPKAEWEIIDGEFATTQTLFTKYAMILAAIGPIAGLIGGQLFGINVLGTVFRPPLLGALVGAVLTYGLGLVSIYVIGLVIDALAPSFGGTKNPIQAMKVAVYSFTASWLAAIFGLIPALAILSIVGLYSFYLLYLGLPRLMNVPQDKAIVYTIVVVLVSVVVVAIGFAIVGAVGGLFTAGAMHAAGVL